MQHPRLVAADFEDRLRGRAVQKMKATAAARGSRNSASREGRQPGHLFTAVQRETGQIDKVVIGDRQAAAEAQHAAHVRKVSQAGLDRPPVLGQRIW